MGYRSNVTICCEEEAYKLLKEAIDSSNTMEPSVRKATSGYFIEYEWVKWDYYKKEQDVLNILNEKEEDGYGYKMIFVGEDNYIKVLSNSGGDEVFEDMYEEISIHLPEDYVAVSVHLPEEFHKDKWIPCNKQVPKETGWYLVSREDGTVNTSFWFKEKTWKEGHNSKILAWQSLPKAFCS